MITPDVPTPHGGAAPPGAPIPEATTRAALDQLAEQCYAELEQIARRERRPVAHLATLDTSALVHDAFLRLAQQRQLGAADRAHFLAAAAGTIRRVVIDHVRRRRAGKRGGDVAPITLDERLGIVELRDEALLALDEALARLAQAEPRLARVVECRYFVGMSDEETAEALGVTTRTVRRDWVKARGWLYAALTA
jgi:RNA polymerase sigma factor (TIGR02999 family)